MTRKEYLREYQREYNKEGFRKIANRRYYLKHREEILKRIAEKRAQNQPDKG